MSSTPPPRSSRPRRSTSCARWPPSSTSPVLLFSGGKDSIVLLRLAEKAFRPGALPVPADARRHRPQLPRGHRVPRPPRRRARRAPDRRLACRSRSTAAAWSRRPARARRATGCRRRRCSTRSRSTTSTPPSAARAATRSAPGPRSGSSRFRDDFGQLGPAGASAPSCGASTTGASASGEHVRVFPLTQLDRARRLAVHRRGAPRGPDDLLRPRARGLPPRRDALRDLATHVELHRGRGAVHRERALPDGRRHELHGRGRARPRRRCHDVVAEIAATKITERGETRADDRVTEAAMEDRKVAGYF